MTRNQILLLIGGLLFLSLVILGTFYYLHYFGSQGEYPLATRAAVTSSAQTAAAVIAFQSTELARLSAAQTATAAVTPTPSVVPTTFCAVAQVEAAYDQMNDTVSDLVSALPPTDNDLSQELLERTMVSLYSILNDTKGISVPPCMDQTKEYLLKYIENLAAGYQSALVLGELPPNWSEVSSQLADQFATELTRVYLCAPNCN